MHREVLLFYSWIQRLMRGVILHGLHPGRLVAVLFGFLLTASVSASSVTYTYDEAGRLKSTTYSNSASTNYSLDAAGNRKLVQATPAPALPSAPGVPTFTNITATTATLSWAAATGVVASYSYSVNSGAWVNVGSARTASLSGLTTNTPYSVAVIATNASGNGPSSSASFTTLPPLPGAPGVPTFSNITLTSATVTWTLASGTVSSYSYSLNSGAWTSVGTALTVNLSALTAGTAYTVQVRANNLAGGGPASSGSFATPALPGSPGVPTFTGLTATAVTVSWAPASGTVTSYSYSVNAGTWTNVGTALSANLSGLTAGTTYTVQVLATNSGGNSAPSSASFTTLPSAPGVPTFTNITTTTVTASWTPASGTVSSYSYSVNSGAWTNVGAALSASISGLTGSTSYTVQVRATNSGGDGSASSASFTTLPSPPSAPGVPTFASITAISATANWAPASGTVSSYSYSVNSGSWVNVGLALSANLTGLSAGTTYTVQVLASNAGGNGPASSGSFTTSSTYSDTPTMTEGNTTPAGTGGFLSGSFGSMSPTTTTNGHTYISFYDKWAGGMAQTYSFSAFSVAGFSADPGKGWLTSATAQGVTFTGASATYSYASGTATWTWTPLDGFGFNGTGTTVCTIVHK